MLINVQFFTPSLISALLLLGLLSGFCAGLFGIGGGLILVPLLTVLFNALGLNSELAISLALGSSMLAILPTGISSSWAHYQRGAVRWNLFLPMAPTIALGAWSGSWLATRLHAPGLGLFFGVFILVMAAQMWREKEQEKPASAKPQSGLLALASFAIGALSALLAIGGGSLTVPLLHRLGVRLPFAIATSASLGVVIASFASMGYLFAANIASPPWVQGWVVWPYSLILASTAVIAAPLGARCAHKWPMERMRKLFALLLFLLGIKMLWHFW